MAIQKITVWPGIDKDIAAFSDSSLVFGVYINQHTMGVNTLYMQSTEFIFHNVLHLAAFTFEQNLILIRKLIKC